MEKIILLALSLGCASFAAADIQQTKMTIGKWSIAPEWVEKFAPECRGMTLELTADGRIIRTTGELTYITQATFTDINQKIRIDEILIESNSKPSCAGVPASEIVKHLKHSAFYTVSEDRLMYYRGQNKESLIVFSRN